MEKLACILTEHLIRKNVITEEKRCIYEFGFQIGMEVCLNTVISILIAIACGMVVEAIVFSGYLLRFVHMQAVCI